MFRRLEKKFEEVKGNVSGDDRSGKFTSKVSKLFRAFTKNSSLSQSRQQLNSEIEEIDIESQDFRKKQKPEDEIETLDETNFTLQGKKERNSEKIDKFDDEKIEIKSAARKIRHLRRSENVKSIELEPHSSDIVVVDVHRENIGENIIKDSDDNIEEILDDNGEFENDKKVILSSFENSIDSVKKQRKRWSKTSIVIPPKTSSLSSSGNSLKNSPDKNNSSDVKPVPAPRFNKIIDIEKLDDNFGVKNEGFEYDDDEEEQVLRIETENGSMKAAKIEMSSIKSTGDLHRNSQQNVSEDSDNEIMLIKSPEEQRNFSTESVIDLEDSDTSLSSKKLEKLPRKIRKLKTPTEQLSKDQSREDSGTHSETQEFAKAQIFSPDDEKIKKRKRENRKKLKDLSNSSSVESGGVTREKSRKKNVKKNKKTKKSKEIVVDDSEKKEVKFISILIEKADILEADYVTRHPMVIVHIVEIKTGNYLRQSENKKSEGLWLQPLITATFDFKENKTMLPYWNEELIFEHEFNEIMKIGNDQVIILFEIVDLLSFSKVSEAHDQYGGENCWYKIAWAFLKPCGHSGTRHIKRRVRLQLYRPRRIAKKTARNKCEAYSWWKSGSREKYPSTLYVAVSPVDPPRLEPIFYSQMELLPDPINPPSNPSITSLPLQDSINVSRWTRLAAQSCKIPNELYFKTETTENGCFHVVFSNNGKYLACANSEEYNYPIIIYEVENEKILIEFIGHKSFIYSLDWSPNDNFLLSSSSDFSARIWDIKNRLIQEINMLPHPSYVYCGKFDPIKAEKIATGCYDHVLRIWIKKNNSFELFQELEGHDGFINSICFKKDDSLISGDSLGVVIQWSIKKNKKLRKNDFTIIKKIKIKEINNIVINTIILHPLGSRLLVHTRDSRLRMLDLSTGVVLQKYDGLKNFRIQTTARISPCGGLLFCGGEDGLLNIWSIESGKRLGVYQTEPKSYPISCVDYHPYDHVMVYSTFGAPSSAMILRFDKNSNGQNVGLKIFGEEDNKYLDYWREGLMDSDGSRLSRRASLVSSRWRGDTPASHETENDRQALKMRMKILNDTNEPLKTKSANRLTNIIAKIDRILMNNSSARSPYDIEANRLDKSIDTISKFIDKSEGLGDEELSRIMPYVPPLFTNFDDNSGRSVNSMSEARSEAIEMKEFKEKRVDKKKGKSKSARDKGGINSRRDDDRENIFSDGVVQVRGKKKLIKNNFDKNNLLFEGRKIARVGGKENLAKDSGSESAGTYIVDIGDDNKKNHTDCSGESIRSDVTFVIENEKSKKPVPKPRKIKQRI